MILSRHESDLEKEARGGLIDKFKNCPVIEEEFFSNLGLFINSKDIARMLFMNNLYTQILDVPGVVMEFGVKWGGNLSLFSSLRGCYEPYNVRRKVIGFDTFEGFPSIDEKDGRDKLMKVGNLALPKGYEEYLSSVMDCQEKSQPLSHIKKYDVIKGDACKKVEEYLNNNPETIISLAYFDFDIYEPTKVVLELIKDRLTKGSIVAFDELNDPTCPGETKAVMEVLGMNNIRLKRWQYCTKPCWFVVE